VQCSVKDTKLIGRPIYLREEVAMRILNSHNYLVDDTWYLSLSS
jgi:hypothetical protein